MKIKTLFICLLLPLTAFAAPRSASEAARIASELLNSSFDSPRRMTSARRVSARTGDAAFYAFNAEGGGFVLISGDDRAETVLAYSDQGALDLNNLPENARAWLKVYERQMDMLREADLDIPASETVNVYERTVGPLLGATKWDQGSPFNILCPIYYGSERCAAGCMATALAQIMYYHRYPERGQDNVQYQDYYGHNISVDFSSTEYDWDNMLPDYYGEHNGRQDTAVATLLYHCGAAQYMDYSSGSGASEYTTPYALVYYFGYDYGVALVDRSDYDAATWNALVKKEIDEGRPILYTGTTIPREGHAFVIDGYREDGLFHVNWGWGGMSDGYFALSTLNPSVQGVGGASTLDGFNCYQDMVTHIQPPISHPSDASYFYTALSASSLSASQTTYQRSADITIDAYSLYNGDTGGRDVTLALGVYDQNGNLLAVLGQKTDYYMPAFRPKSPGFTVTVPSVIPTGTYQVRLIYKNYDGDEWHSAVYEYGTPCSLTMKVTLTKIIFSDPDYSPQLELLSLEPTTTLYGKNIRTSLKGGFAFSITNHNVEFFDSVQIAMRPVDGDQYTLIGDKIMLNVPYETPVSLSTREEITVSSGTYVLALAVYTTGIEGPTSYLTLGREVEVKLLPLRISTILALETQIAFADNNNVYCDYSNLAITLTNNGTAYCGDIQVYIYAADDVYQNTIMQALTPHFVCLEPGETATIVFDEYFELNAGEYTAYAYYTNLSGSSLLLKPREDAYVNFTMRDGTYTSLGDSKADLLSVMPNPATDRITVKSLTDTKVTIYSTTGQKVLEGTTNTDINVSALPRGLYIVKAADKISKLILNTK